jgi:hypothetical protein
MHTLTIRTKFTFGDRVCWEDSCGRRATTGTVVGIILMPRRPIGSGYEIEYFVEYDDDPHVHFSHRESNLAPLAPPAASAVSRSRKRPAATAGTDLLSGGAAVRSAASPAGRRPRQPRRR